MKKILGVIGIILITPVLLLGILLTVMGFVEKIHAMPIVGIVIWAVTTYGLVMIKTKCFLKKTKSEFCIHCGATLINRPDVCESCGCILDEDQVIKSLKNNDRSTQRKTETKTSTTRMQNNIASGLFGSAIKIRTHDPMVEYGIVKSKTDVSSADLLLDRLRESVEIMDKTVKPDIFFKRLHYSFDVMLELMSYKDRIFSNKCTPEEQYWSQFDYIETRVSKFIDRSYSNIQFEASKLKTEKGRQNKLKNWYYGMLSAFENCHSFWLGNSICPHYRGVLYTSNNFRKLQELEQYCLVGKD